MVRQCFPIQCRVDEDEEDGREPEKPLAIHGPIPYSVSRTIDHF
jgi:hypothetical protein